MPRVGFDSTKKLLSDLLKEARKGAIQLPDFQRGWVWDDEGLRELLSSVSRSFPIGTLMTLEAGGEVRFKPRLIEGAPSENARVQHESLLLDGQQRITSLYQTTMRQEVVETLNTKRGKIKRFYYIDMVKALNGTDRLEAIVGVPERKIETRHFGKKVIRDLSTEKHEYAKCMFPTNKIFDSDDWQMGFSEYWNYDKDKSKFWFQFSNEVLQTFRQYQIPVIALGRDTSREAVCLVFEKVNTAGKKLDAFELLTAIYAGEEEGFHLRESWAKTAESIKRSILLQNHPLTRLQPTDFFQALALLHTRARRESHIENESSGDPPAISCTRDTVLRIPLSAYKDHSARLEEGFKKAGKFLFRQHIYWFKDVPYRSQIVPMATILAELGDCWERDDVHGKIAQWYWCGVFGELYGGATETRFARDLPDMLAWIDDGKEEPTTIKDAAFRAERLDTMTSRLSAAYKGVHALLMKEGARDFISGQSFDQTTYFDESVDIHHIFPKKWCKEFGIDRKRYETIINKTPLNHRTNRKIGGDAPSQYLARLPDQGGPSREELNEHLRSHLIEPETLRADDFERFISSRREALLEKIGDRIDSKRVYKGQLADEPEEAAPPIDEDEEIEATE